MVDIPEIKREYSAAPDVQSPVSLNVPQVSNAAADQVSKSLGEGVDYFHKQVETASNDEATKAYNSLRDTAEIRRGF